MHSLKTLCIALTFANLPLFAATITVTNYSNDYPDSNAFVNSSGVKLNQTFVGVGYFNTLLDSELQSLNTTRLTSITTTSEFVQLGSIPDLAAAWLEAGGFSGSASATISGLTNANFIGKAIYVLMGNAATLGASTELIIAKHDTATFASGPTFSANAIFDQSGPGGDNVNILWGGVGLTPNAAIGGASSGPTFSTLGVGAVPEPSRAMLAAMGLFAGLVRRRRK